MEVKLKGRTAQTKYPETLQTMLKFGFIFVDVYENSNRPLKPNSLDDTIKDFMKELSVSAQKDG